MVDYQSFVPKDLVNKGFETKTKRQMNMKTKVYQSDAHIVMPLLVFALAANLFLFAVSYSNASFYGQERTFPDIFGPAQISQNLDHAINQVVFNVQDSLNFVATEIKPAVVAFIGLDGYHYGASRQTALAPEVQSYVTEQGAVLGAVFYNPAYFVGQ